MSSETPKRRIGLIILVLGIAATALATYFGRQSDVLRETGRTDPVTVTGFHGGEKSAFLRNQEVIERLSKHGVTVDSDKAGSVEMVRSMDVAGKDCIWPSNQVAVELYRSTHGQPLTVENVFRSPLVLYTWNEVAEALEQRQIVETLAAGHSILRLDRLVELAFEGVTWEEVGLSQLYGKLRIFSTDPTRSNSGNMFYGLLATLLNQGEVVSEASLEAVLPRLVDYYRRMGHMEHSSSDIFEAFLEQGMGARPIIAGYENQIIEFALLNPQYSEVLRQRIRILYPVPTVWSDHPLISRAENCKRLAEGLRDERIQELAWTQHGFRSGLIGVGNDPSVLSVVGVPETIDAVVPMPSAPVMERILEALGAASRPG